MSGYLSSPAVCFTFLPLVGAIILALFLRGR